MLIEISDIYDDDDRWIKVLGVKLPWPFPITHSLSSSSAKVFGRSIYGGNGKSRPITDAFFKIFRAASDAKYWFKYRFVKDHKYNVVYTDLKPGYYDIDTLMLHGVMALVCRYVDGERGGRQDFLDRIAWLEDDSQHREVDAEMIKDGEFAKFEKQVLEIYDWWKTGRHVDRERRRFLVNKLFGYRKAEDRFEIVEGTKFYRFKPKKFSEEEEKEYVEMKALDEKIDSDETKYLKLAVELRGGMWT